MSIQDVLRVKKRYQWKNGVHVLYSVGQTSERFPGFDFLVGWSLSIALTCFHFLYKLKEIIGLDFSPKSFLPLVELVIDKSNEIPHLL